MHLVLAVDPGSCASALFFASPVIIAVSAVYFLRRSDRKSAAAPAVRSPLAADEESREPIGRR